MYRDIFIPLLTYPDATSEADLQQLLGMVAGQAAHVSVCAYEIDIPRISNRYGAGLVDTAGMAAAAAARSKSSANTLLAIAASTSSTITTGSLQLPEYQVGNTAAQMARNHDAAIVLIENSSVMKRELAEHVIFGSGRPVLLIPEDRQAALDFKAVAVAWDGSRAAARAVADAMPILQAAAKIVLLTAFDDKEIGEKSILGLGQYLERHGMGSEHRDLSTVGKGLGRALQQGARESGAGLLVMGAFGHSRIRDFVLGGATRSVLEDLRMPVLLSH